MKVGSCRAAFPKFYYDVTNQSCRSFTYGGCEANGNHFDSQEDCEAACSGVTGNTQTSDQIYNNIYIYISGSVTTTTAAVLFRFRFWRDITDDDILTLRDPTWGSRL